MTARPLSPAEAEVVARFDAAEPAPESWRGDDGLRCFCDRDRAGHGWSLDEGCTRSPVLIQGDPLREAIERVVSPFEVFTAGDGQPSIRQREQRSAIETTNAILALPEFAALRAKAAAADRVRELIEDAAEMNDETARSLRRPTDIKARHEGLRDAYRDAADHLRRALDGPAPC